MTNRVLLDQNGLKVSRPGVNVLTASVGDLIFSSDFGSLGFYDEGQLTYAWSISGGSGSFDRSVPLGKTFATPPLVVFQISLGGGTFVNVGNASGFVFEKEDFEGIPSYMVTYATVNTADIRFGGIFERDSNPSLSSSFTVRYSIYEYNL